mgnify:CR=1 FL=1
MSAAVRSLARTSLALLFSVLLAGPAWSAAVLDEAEALRIGQAAIGRQLDDYVLRDTSARRVALADSRSSSRPWTRRSARQRRRSARTASPS